MDWVLPKLIIFPFSPIAHALKAYFVCNDEKRDSISEEDLQDPKTNMKFKKISIQISKPDTMDVIGHDFGCKCLASSAKGQVESKEAIIKPACEYIIIISY